MLHNYLTAVDDWHADLVTDAVDLIIRGELPNHDGRFAPTAPMLATACRLAAEKAARAKYLAGLAAPRLPPPLIEHTPESRERVRQLAKHAAEVIGSVDLHNSEAEIAAANARWAKVNAHFDPPQDYESLTERLNLHRDSLGYEVGAPESEENAA